MNEEYQKGIQIGELMGKIESIQEMLETHVKKQDELNEKMDKRVTIAEQWIQTTTGKVVILTAIFSLVGSICYIIVNWMVNHWR